MTEVPHAFEVGNGSLMEFSDESAFWIFNQVSNLAYTRYNLMIPFIQEKQRSLELGYIEQVKEMDEKAKAIENEEELLSALTAFSVDAGQNTFKEWKQMYQFLFTRYLDGNVKSPVEVPEDHLYVNPKLEQPGYSEHWYKKVVEDTGEKLLYQEDGSH